MSNPVKTCPACGNGNGPGDIFCTVCGADISHVETDQGQGHHPPSTGNFKKSPATSITNLSGPSLPCPRCGYRNPSFVMLCPHCGADIPHTTGITAVQESAAQNSDTPDTVLRATIDGQTYELKPGDVLGREGSVAANYFWDIGTVSRRHVIVGYRDNSWQLMVPCTVKNVTQLDGQELPRDEPTPLQGSHRLKLSTRCEVQLAVSAT